MNHQLYSSETVVCQMLAHQVMRQKTPEWQQEICWVSSLSQQVFHSLRSEASNPPPLPNPVFPLHNITLPHPSWLVSSLSENIRFKGTCSDAERHWTPCWQQQDVTQHLLVFHWCPYPVCEGQEHVCSSSAWRSYYGNTTWHNIKLYVVYSKVQETPWCDCKPFIQSHELVHMH